MFKESPHTRWKVARAGVQDGAGGWSDEEAEVVQEAKGESTQCQGNIRSPEVECRGRMGEENQTGRSSW